MFVSPAGPSAMREAFTSVLFTIMYRGLVITAYNRRSVTIGERIFLKNEASQFREVKQQAQVHMASNAGFELSFV